MSQVREVKSSEKSKIDKTRVFYFEAMFCRQLVSILVVVGKRVDSQICAVTFENAC